MGSSIDTSMATRVPPEHLGVFLPAALPWIQKTIEEQMYERWSLGEIIYNLQTGDLQLWTGTHSGKYFYVITQLDLPLVHIILGGGELDEERAIMQHLALIEHWAKGMGAKTMTIWGRLGWKKLLKPYGYTVETVAYRRPLTDRMI